MEICEAPFLRALLCGANKVFLSFETSVTQSPRKLVLHKECNQKGERRGTMGWRGRNKVVGAALNERKTFGGIGEGVRAYIGTFSLNIFI